MLRGSMHQNRASNGPFSLDLNKTNVSKQGILKIRSAKTMSDIRELIFKEQGS